MKALLKPVVSETLSGQRSKFQKNILIFCILLTNTAGIPRKIGEV